MAEGFSSTQELVRVFLKKLADRAISISFNDDEVYLSASSRRRYSAMIKDAESGQNIIEVDPNNLLEHL